MKRSSLLFCFMLSVVLLYGAVCPISAQAPKTAKIVFMSSRDLNAEIYLMNPDGSEPVNLTKNLAHDLYPVWSPASSTGCNARETFPRPTGMAQSGDNLHYEF